MAKSGRARSRPRGENVAQSAGRKDKIIDTNVLIVATGLEPGRDLASHVPGAIKERAHNWLRAFRADADRMLVCDDAYQIWQEYKRKLTEQDFGFAVVREIRFQSQRMRTVAPLEIPRALEKPIASLRNDRKFVAVALADAPHSSIVNASDTDWERVEAELTQHDVHVEHIDPSWYASECQRKNKSNGARRRG